MPLWTQQADIYIAIARIAPDPFFRTDLTQIAVRNIIIAVVYPRRLKRILMGVAPSSNSSRRRRSR